MSTELDGLTDSLHQNEGPLYKIARLLMTGIAPESTPASASAPGTRGQIVWASGYIYVCTATDTWKRVAIATW